MSEPEPTSDRAYSILFYGVMLLFVVAGAAAVYLDWQRLKNLDGQDVNMAKVHFEGKPIYIPQQASFVVTPEEYAKNYPMYGRHFAVSQLRSGRYEVWVFYGDGWKFTRATDSSCDNHR